MKRTVAVLTTILAIGYFGYVRESEARCLRMRAKPTGCAPVVCLTPCAAAIAIAAPSAPVAKPPSTEPRKVAPKPIIPPTPPPTAKPTPLGKLYGVLITDDGNPDSGSANKAGGALMQKILASSVPAARLGKIETVNGNAATSDRVRDLIAGLPVAADDTVVCYYSGAATYDDTVKTYMLTPTGGGRISRAELRAELLLQKAGLTVLLTDSPVHRVQPENVPALPDAGGPYKLESLLFRQKGLIDIHASAANQKAFPRGDEGGLFTLAFAQAASQPTDSWAKLIEDASTTTERLYRAYRQSVLSSNTVTAEDKRAYREQASQTPAAQSTVEQVAPSSQLKPKSPRAAQLVVKAPIGARLTIDGKTTRQFGAVRRFETPELAFGRSYSYSLLIETADHNTDERSVMIRAGEVVEVDFTSAPAASRLASR